MLPLTSCLNDLPFSDSKYSMIPDWKQVFAGWISWWKMKKSNTFDSYECNLCTINQPCSIFEPARYGGKQTEHSASINLSRIFNLLVPWGNKESWRRLPEISTVLGELQIRLNISWTIYFPIKIHFSFDPTPYASWKTSGWGVCSDIRMLIQDGQRLT